MTEEERAQLNARLDAIKLAIEFLFAGAPGGMKARAEFMERLEAYAQAAPHEGPDSNARLYELERWRPGPR